MTPFFDTYPEFYETGYNPRRLGARYEVLIEKFLELIAGKTIIDLGSHNGRWAFAALKAGAKKVICVEGHSHLADAQERIFSHYTVDKSAYQIIVGDALEVLKTNKIKCDTVFLLGIYYHINNHIDWIRAIRETDALHVFIDTDITPCNGEYDNIVRFRIEDSAYHMNSPFETFSGFGRAAVGDPSRAFVNYSLRVFGYSTREVDWRPYVAKWGRAELEDYASDKRATFVAERTR